MADYELSEAALVELVGFALEAVEGVRLASGKGLGGRRRPVRIGREDGALVVELGLVAAYGRPLVELGREVQRAVTEGLKATAGLPVARVDVVFLEVEPGDAA